MLIYDHNKQFLGLDNEDLQQLGFASAASLFKECTDFADLFVKRPGYIHNFKNFEWIDFVLHAEAEESNAIIHTPKNNFTCKLVIKPFYLSSSPNEHGYMVLLQNLQALSVEEDAKVAHDIEMHPTPKVSAINRPSTITPLPDVSLPNFDDMPATELSEPDIFDVPIEENSFNMPGIKEKDETIAPFKLDVEDIYTDSPASTEKSFEAESFIPEPIISEPKKSNEEELNTDAFTLPEQALPEESSFISNAARSNLPDIPMLGDQLSKQDQEYISHLHTKKDYIYDPHIAADELGLPVDLIEEFIGDFIQQSHDFHDELFEKVNAQDRDSVQTLSHKLKGVAANLRIEDAFEVLTIINTSHDFDEITANLKYYYHLIAKLEGDESMILALEENKNIPEEIIQAPAEDIHKEIIVGEEVEEEIKQESKEEIIEAPKEPVDTSDDDIYSFEMPNNDSETFDIPQKPPVFEEIDDDIYDFKTIEKSIKEEELFETEKEEELFEIKQSDDEPLLIIEPEIKTEENLFDDRNFLDPVETLDPQIEIAEEGIFDLDIPKETSIDKVEVAPEISEKVSETPLPIEEISKDEEIIESTSKNQPKKDEVKFNTMAEKFQSIGQPQNQKRKQKTKKQKSPFIKTQKVETKPEVKEEITQKPQIFKIPTPPPEVILDYDTKEVSDELGLSHELVKELIADFKADTLLHVDEISNAISSFDTATWQKLAKEYKGISDNLRLKEILTELQMLIRTNDAQKAKTALSRYRNYVNQL
jgi:HPt (histidine-containing phosphotransfer) domain-containing protein